MADPNALGDVAKFATGGVSGAALLFMLNQVFGGLLKGWLSGTTGQEKELRGDLAAERAQLSNELSKCREENAEAHGDLRQMNRMYLHMLTTRAEARAALKAVEKLQGIPETVWPPDPPEPLNTPGGGTP